MAFRRSFLLVFAFACASGISNANQSYVSSQSLTDNDASTYKEANRNRSTATRSTTRNRYRDFYLVNDAESYSGDSLSLGQRQYQLSRAGVESAGRVFLLRDLLLLWNTGANSYDLLKVEAVESGVWKSCWGQDVESVRSCGENTELIYIFEDENTAADFNNSGDDELAMGPEPEPTQPEPAPEPAEPEPAPEPAEPEPAPEPAEPEPAPEPAKPEPAPAPTEPEPAPAPTEPEPAPEPTEPEPAPEPTEPEPAPEPAEPEPTPAPAPAEPEPTEPVNTADVSCAAPSAELKAALLKSTNDLRSQARQCGTQSFASAGSLVWNNALAAAARTQSNDMANNNFFSHTGSDGLQVWDRAVSEGYQYRYIGENIAAGQNTVGVVQQGWINSPGHCRNIMNPQITEMGAACVVNSGSDYGNYWTVVVGQPR